MGSMRNPGSCPWGRRYTGTPERLGPGTTGMPRRTRRSRCGARAQLGTPDGSPGMSRNTTARRALLERRGNTCPRTTCPPTLTLRRASSWAGEREVLARCRQRTPVRCRGWGRVRCRGLILVRCRGWGRVRCRGLILVPCRGWGRVRCRGLILVRCRGGDRSDAAGGDRSDAAGGLWSDAAGGDGSDAPGRDHGSDAAGRFWSDAAGGDGSDAPGRFWSDAAGGDGSRAAPNGRARDRAHARGASPPVTQRGCCGPEVP